MSRIEACVFLVPPISVDNYDDDYKMSKEEMYREAMLRANDSSSSPEFDRFSPFLDEEKYVAGRVIFSLVG